MSATILAIGLLVFFAHFLSLLFRKTGLPDVLVLMLAGIALGPAFGIVTPQDFGKVGPLIATIALVVILFEGGTSLSLDVLGRAMRTTCLLTFPGFILTAAVFALIGHFALGLSPLAAALLGLILGGTSSAVIIPMVGALNLSEKTATVLVLESALTDVLSIVGVFALLQIHAGGSVEPSGLVGGVLASLVFSAAIGALGGIGWLLVLGKVRGFPNTISSTLAYAFIVYGAAELLGLSGAIAALMLGITMTNSNRFGLHRFPSIDRNIEALNATDLAFYGEAVFLLKTYFFVYLGISIRFGDALPALAAAVAVLLVYALRLLLARFVFRDSANGLRDTAIASMLAPKGLAAAVLAALPLEYGVAGGELIRDASYMTILVSIALTAALVIVYPHRSVRRFYARTLNKPLPEETTAS